MITKGLLEPLRLAPLRRRSLLIAFGLSVALHVLAFVWAIGQLASTPKPHVARDAVVYLPTIAAPPQRVTAHKSAAPSAARPRPPAPQPANDTGTTQAIRHQGLATQAAPPAPTAEEWAFAARYTLKNSKGYRYSWGQQVRSQMGTAVEGADAGLVRFRVEIAPDGQLARLDTLWTTSAAAERLARQVIAALPPLPPTPTGQPLIFEKTVSFSPFASDGPPTYQDDCLPDPPLFRNPFVWDGKSPQVRAAVKPAEKPDPQALEDCKRQLPQDTPDAEAARDRRLIDQSGSPRLAR